MMGGDEQSTDEDSESIARTFAASPLEPNGSAFARTLVENTSEGLLTVDEAGTIVFANPAIERLLGYAPTELVGESLQRLVPDRFIEPHLSAFSQYVETGERRSDWDSLELYARHEQGHEVPVTVSFREHHHDGQRLFTGVVRDRSGRLEREQTLQEREQQFRTLVDAVEGYAICRLDPQGHVETWNQGATDLTGYDAEEILGSQFAVFYPDAAVDAGVPEESLSAAAAEGTVNNEGWRIRKDGTRFWASVTLTAIRDEEGTLTGFAKVIRDLTQQRREQRRRQLMVGTSRSIADAETAEDALRAALRTLCEQTVWDFGEAWLPNGDGADLHRVLAVDVADPADQTDSRWTADQSNPADVVSRVLDSGTTEWVTGPGATYRLSDADGALAEETPMGTALAVPIEADGTVVAVVVLGTTVVCEPDAVLRETVELAVSDLGVVVARMRAETELQRERAFLDQLFETSPVGILVAEPDGVICRVNDHTEQLFGLTASNIVGRRYDELAKRIHDEDGNRVRPEAFPITQVFEREKPVFDYEFSITRFDGDERWLSASSAPVHTGDGDVELVVAAVRDVTDRKCREQELERRLRQQQVTTELGQVALETSDVEDLFAAAASAVREMLETDSCAVFDHDPAQETLHVRSAVGQLSDDGDDESLVLDVGADAQPSETFREGSPALVNDGRSDAGEPQLLPTAPNFVSGVTVCIGPRADPWGVLGAFDTETNQFTDHDSNFVQSVAAILASAVERATADRKVRAFREAVEQAGHSIYLTDVDGTIEYVNPAFETLTGYDAAEAIGRNPRLLQSGLHSDAFYADLWETILGGEVWQGEVTNERKSGERFTVNQTIAPVTDEAGDIERFVAINADITERKEREQTLERQRRSLQRIRQLTESLRPLNRALARASTREEIEQAVCEQLAASDAYQFAWYGGYNPAADRVTPRAWSGFDVTDLDSVNVVADGEEHEWEPLGAAVRTETVWPDRTLDAAAGLEPWPTTVPRNEVKASAVVPVVFDETIYGVVGLYSDRPNAFDEYERVLLQELGERVGHALNAAKNKQLLHTDTAVEVEFRTTTTDDACVATSLALGCHLTLETLVPTRERQFVGYLTVDGAAPEAVRERLSEESTVESARVVHGRGSKGRLEYVVKQSPATTLITYGATIRSFEVEDGFGTIRAEVAPEADIHEIADGVQAAYDDTSFVAKRTIDWSAREPAAGQERIGDVLTDRQAEVLELAYHAGFFESPRESTGEELAASLGISSPTFYVHVRNGMQKVLRQLVDAQQLR